MVSISDLLASVVAHMIEYRAGKAVSKQDISSPHYETITKRRPSMKMNKACQLAISGPLITSILDMHNISNGHSTMMRPDSSQFKK